MLGAERSRASGRGAQAAAERRASRRQRRPERPLLWRGHVLDRWRVEHVGGMFNGLPSSKAVSAEDGYLWGEDRAKRYPALATSAFFFLPLRKCRAYDTQQRKKNDA
jgi:hypothetical protein